jgi:hypothetical protein
MLIKLLKKASWGGKSHKAGTVLDDCELTAQKLIKRDYAEEHDLSKDVKDADQPE